MLHLSVIFLVLSLSAALLGFVGVAGEFIWLAKAFFLVFLVLFIITATVSAIIGRPSA